MLEADLATIEALLFVSPEGIEVATLGRAAGIAPERAETLLETLDAHYRASGHGLRVQRSGEYTRLVTAPGTGAAVARLTGEDRRPRLSTAALDTLAIVAYRQPVTRATIESIRGVGSDHVLAVLLNMGLIEEKGRAESIGRPVLYGTAATFLESAGLASVRDLPPLPEVLG
jgi:segregation and condensation protein B